MCSNIVLWGVHQDHLSRQNEFYPYLSVYVSHILATVNTALEQLFSDLSVTLRTALLAIIYVWPKLARGFLLPICPKDEMYGKKYCIHG